MKSVVSVSEFKLSPTCLTTGALTPELLPQSPPNRSCSRRKLKLKVFPAHYSPRWRQPLFYGTSTRYPQVAIHRSMDRYALVLRFEFNSAAQRFLCRWEHRAQTEKDSVR